MTPSLFALPLELRLQIYRNLLLDTALLELAYKTRTASKQESSRRFCQQLLPKANTPQLTDGPNQVKKWQSLLLKSELSTTLHTAILATCRQVHEEATAIFYQENGFYISDWRLQPIKRNRVATGISYD